MKEGRSLQDLAAELTRQMETKRDFIADTRKVRLEPNIMPDEDFALLLEDVDIFTVGQNAHRQIGQRCNIPAKYYDRMREYSPELLCKNVNHWLAEEPCTRMVRTMDNRARAFLSDRYRTLDNYQLAEAALPAIADTNAQIISCEVTHNKLYLKAIVPDVKEEIGPPEGFEWGKGHQEIDVVQPGIVISNSEVGMGSLSIQPAVHTIACSNLAVWRENTMRRYHVGQALGGGAGKADAGEVGIWQYLSDESKVLADAAIWSQVKDLIGASLKGDVFADRVAELRAARGNRIEGDPVKAVEQVSLNYQFSKDEQAGVLRHLVEGGDLTQYGVHSAVTRAAAQVESYDRASELEQYGADVVLLPQNDWQKIAQAA